MSEPLPVLVENATQIAWEYPEKLAELTPLKITSWLLLDTIDYMVRCGEIRGLVLSKGAITAGDALEDATSRNARPAIRLD